MDRCGLCSQERELRDSHLLPAAVYKLAREPHRRDPNPVVITRRRAGTSSRQVSDHFLCSECENRFSRNGERYVLGQCARPDGFALRDQLLLLPVFCDDQRFRVYEVSSILGSRVEHYLYFAASVFWRAGARSWTVDGDRIARIELGSEYQEQLRRYLLGQGPFPINARLFVHVWSDADIHYTTVFPCSTRVEGVRRHKFCIPGILFVLFLGHDAPRLHDGGALNSRAGHFMWLCPWTNDSLFSGFGKLAMQGIQARQSRNSEKRRAA